MRKADESNYQCNIEVSFSIMYTESESEDEFQPMKTMSTEVTGNDAVTESQSPFPTLMGHRTGAHPQFL